MSANLGGPMCDGVRFFDQAQCGPLMRVGPVYLEECSPGDRGGLARLLKKAAPKLSHRCQSCGLFFERSVAAPSALSDQSGQPHFQEKGAMTFCRVEKRVTRCMTMAHQEGKKSAFEPELSKGSGSMRVRAAVTEQRDASFELEDVALDAPRADEVLVRMVATGICATDAHVRQQLIPAPLPAVLGHEGAGIVVAVGTSVAHLHVGDHVVLSYHWCGQCKPCLSGHAAYCDNLWQANFAGARLDGSIGVQRQGGGKLHAHFFGQSSFATYALAHQRNAIKVPRDVPLEILAPLGCGLQTGAGAILNALKVPIGGTVVVFGVGAVGLAAIMASKVADAATVIAVDVNAARLELARELGATHVINAASVNDIAAAIRQIESRGVEFALDTSGRASNLEAGIGALAPLGRFGFVAFGEHSNAVLDASKLTVGQTLQGIIQGDAASSLMIPDLIGLYRSGRFPFDRLITFYDFEDINAAFDDATSGRVIKAVLRFPTEEAH
jgi:aryl-alcohol dehydrogenase